MLQEHTKIIPRKILFGNPDRIFARLSPNGEKVAHIAPYKGVRNIWVSSANNIDTSTVQTNNTDHGIIQFTWAYTSNHILYLQDNQGNESWNLHCVSLNDGKDINLTPFENVHAKILHLSPLNPTEILVELNLNENAYHSIYKLNIITSELVLIEENKEYFLFVSDDLYCIRIALKEYQNGAHGVFKKVGTEWLPLLSIPFQDTLTTYPISIDKNGDTLYMMYSLSRDKSALAKINLETGSVNIESQNEQSDAVDVLLHPTTGKPQAVVYNYYQRFFHVIDNDISHHISHLQALHDGEMRIVDRTQNDQFWVVGYIKDTGPIHYYRYNTIDTSLSKIFTSKNALEKIDLSPLHCVTIKSRDELDLVSYYTLPLQADPQNTGIPNTPLPTVLLVHGGPSLRDEWGLIPHHQLFASRGYAVLSTNFRGSTGFGKTFANAGNLQWGKKMQTDLLDAVQWAVDNKIADPSHVAIMGGSYGGYAALWGLSATPTIFSCGVCIAGASKLIELLESTPTFWQPKFELEVKTIGDPRTKEGRRHLEKSSPYSYANDCMRPLLIIHGKNDPIVKVRQSEEFANILVEQKIPVTFALFPDEGHNIRRPQNRMALNAVVELFLAKYMGGQYENIDHVLENSSITFPILAKDIADAIKIGSIKDRVGKVI